MELFAYNKMLGNIDDFPKLFIKPLAEMGITNVKHLETAELNTISRCIYDQRITAPDQANEPIMIGAEMATSLKIKYRCTAPLRTTIDSQRDRYVYRSQTARKIVIKRTMTALISDGNGAFTKGVLANPISVLFEGGRNSCGTLIVTKSLAKHHGMDIDSFRNLIEDNSQFGNEFFLVSRSEEDAVLQSAKGTGPKIRAGVRATSDV